MMRKPILCLDFDGVIHSYTSGWRGASVILDPPVPGALEFIVRALEHFEVHILSSRSHQRGGKRAMKRWLRKYLRWEMGARHPSPTNPPEWAKPAMAKYGTMKPYPHDAAVGYGPMSLWPHNVIAAVDGIMGEIKWPWFKPPAMLTLDDRAVTFTGTWPKVDEFLSFKPWNKA